MMQVITQDIIDQKLPIPLRDIRPITKEEEIICLADKFYSKGKEVTYELSIEEIKFKLSKYGKDSLERFENLLQQYIK